MKNKHNLSNLLFRFQAGIIILLLIVYSPFNLTAQNLAVADTQTIEDLFEYVENNSDYSVFYQNDQVNLKQKVSFTPKKGSIDDILDQTLPQCGLTYKYVDNHIVITPQKTTKNSPQQEFIIKGKVTDETGESLIGVNIIIEGTTTGTVTDFDGNYTLEVSDPNITLVFSYIGYRPVSIPVNGQSEINVVLQMDAIALDEIVAIGYGTKKKADITGSVAVINSDEISKLPVPTIDQALQGKATGVKITQNTGAPGEGVSVRIRGIGTINDNTPLYVVDGIPTKDAFSTLSPADIESISILKDASASIYGARAANGVILITTKQGTEGKSVINYSTYTGVQTATNLTEMCNKNQYIELYNEAAIADGRDPMPAGMADTLPNTNWWDEIFRPAIITNHNLSISGGNEKTNYLISGSYFKQDGVILNSGHDRFSMRTSINSKLTDQISIGTNINLSKATTDLIGSSGDGYGGNGGSVVRYAFFRTPIYSVYDQNGEYIDYYHDYAEIFGDGYNPVGFAEKYDWTKVADRAFGNAYISWQITDALVFKSDYGIDYKIIEEKRFDENWGNIQSTGNGRINDPNTLTQSTNYCDIRTWKNTLTYDKNYNEVHNLNILLGLESINSYEHGQNGSAQNFPDQADNFRYLDNGTINELVGGWEQNWALFSIFGRIAYNYKSKYYADVILRRDGSSRFGSNYPYGFFPSGTLGWRIDKENFLVNNNFISHLKLRLSAGVMGNQEINNYSFASSIGGGAYYPFGTTSLTGYYFHAHGNENLRWERQTQYNVGIDIGLLENRLFLYCDYYYKLTDDMLLPVDLPPSSGSATAPWINAGKVLNQGIDIEINFKNNFKKLKYNLGLVFSYYSNEVLELYGGNPIPYGRIDNGRYATLLDEGHPIGSFYLLEMEGIFQDETDIFTHAWQGNDIQPGDVKYKDISGPDGVPDGIINDYDRTHVGSPLPDFTYGFTSNLNYKNFDFSFFIEGVYGNEIYWQAAHDVEGFYRGFNVTENVYDERWTGPGTSDTQPRVSWTAAGYNNKEPSTRFLFDGSYLRLKNVTLGYTFDNSLIKRVGMKSLKIFISGQNLYTITNYPGLDPEMQTSDNAKGEGDVAVGIDWGTYPSARVFSIGLNVQF